MTFVGSVDRTPLFDGTKNVKNIYKEVNEQ